MKIRYYGHNGKLTGYGRAADEMVEALAAAGAELEVRPLAPPDKWNRAIATSRFFTYDRDMTKPDVIIVHDLPLSIEGISKAIPEQDLAVPVVAYTTWEAEDVADVVMRSLERTPLAQLWVPSAVTGAAFMSSWDPRAERSKEDACPMPLQVVPHAFDEARDYTYTGERPPAPFTFYWIGAWSARKNPLGLVRAFCAEFTKDENVRLLIQCKDMPPPLRVQSMFATGLPQEQWPNVVFSDKALSEPELWSLHALGDVFVTASRGEAWNLPAFEAMLAGRHVIAPAGQGSDEFLEDTTARLYKSFLTPAQADIAMSPAPAGSPPGMVQIQMVGAQGLDCRCDWQEPDLEDLRVAMRNAYMHRTRDLHVDYDVAAEFGRQAVGKRALGYLQEIVT